MTVMVLVNIKRGSERHTGTAGRLDLVEAPGFDKTNPTPESLETLATCAWTLYQTWWDYIEDITWQDDRTKVTYVLGNPMRKEPISTK